MKRVGYFKVGKPKFDSVGRMIFRKIKEIAKDDISNSFVVTDHDNIDLCYTFLNEEKTNQIKNIFSKNKVLIDYYDITNLVLSGSPINEEFNISFSDSKNKELLDNFVKENLTIDMVLDKILKSGIQSINENDIDVLKTKKP